MLLPSGGPSDGRFLLLRGQPGFNLCHPIEDASAAHSRVAGPDVHAGPISQSPDTEAEIVCSLLACEPQIELMLMSDQIGFYAATSATAVTLSPKITSARFRHTLNVSQGERS
jgi:hypothetical protein